MIKILVAYDVVVRTTMVVALLVVNATIVVACIVVCATMHSTSRVAS
jgi:hypothetical protein